MDYLKKKRNNKSFLRNVIREKLKVKIIKKGEVCEVTETFAKNGKIKNVKKRLQKKNNKKDKDLSSGRPNDSNVFNLHRNSFIKLCLPNNLLSVRKLQIQNCVSPLNRKSSLNDKFMYSVKVNMASGTMIKEFYDFITAVTLEAGKLVVEGFHGTKIVETKGGKVYDLVTDCDKKVEELFCARIKERYPDHVILGEETLPPGVTPKLTNSPTWIIDPIDGTLNFIYGVPLIGISIALVIQKEVVIGIVFNPVMNEFFSAIKGEGAYCNGKRINSNKNEDLSRALISNDPSLASLPLLHDRTLERMRKICEVGVFGFRCLGSIAVSLCYVANGSLGVYFTDGYKCWDVAAGVLILQEAGGCASSPDGGEFDMFSNTFLVAGNKVLLQKMSAILKECDEKTSKLK